MFNCIMNTKEFISKKNIGSLYKIINKNHKYGKTKDKKKKVIDKLINNMKKVYKSLEVTKINNRNYKNIFDQFNKISIDETLKSLDNKLDINNNKYRRDFKSTPKREVNVMSRPHSTKNQQESRTKNQNSYKIPKNEFGAIARDSGDVFITSKKLQEAFFDMQSSLGFVANYSGETLETMTNLTKRLGLGKKEAAEMTSLFKLQGNNTEEIASNTMDSLTSTIKLGKVALSPKQIFAEISPRAVQTERFNP